jgi:ribonuclease D
MEEAHEAFDELLSIGAHASPFNPNGFWSINGISNLAPRQKAILRELYLFRERAAQERDRPPFKVMSDSVLLRLAEREPSALGAIRNIPGMSNGQVHRYGEGILGCIRHGRTAKAPPRPPRPPRPDQGLLARYDALRNWRKQRARKRGVESDVIVSKDVLWKLAKVYPRTPEQLAAVKDLGPWKRKTYGDEILRVLGQASGTS